MGMRTREVETPPGGWKPAQRVISPPAGRLLTGLAWPMAALAAIAAAAGLAPWPWLEPVQTSFISVRGHEVELFVSGLYRFDSLLAGAGHRGTDAITLLIAVPALLSSARAFSRGSLRGGLLYLGTLTWFLYAYGSFALGVAVYNELFLLYVAIFGLALFTFIATFRELESLLDERGVPRVTGLAAFMGVSAVATLGIWLLDPLTSLLNGTQPVALANYSTLFTYALDLGVVVPAAGIAAWGLLRRRPWAYLVAGSLLTLLAMLAPMIAAQTISQLAAGVRFTLLEALGPIGGFVALSAVSVGFLYRLVALSPGAGSAGGAGYA